MDLSELQRTMRMRCVRDGGDYVFRRVGEVRGRSVALGGEVARITASDGDVLDALLGEITMAWRDGILYAENVADADEMLGLYVIQRRIDLDYTVYDDLVDEEGSVRRFTSIEEASAYLEAALDEEYDTAMRSHNAHAAKWREEKERFEQRRAVLEEHGLWCEGVLREVDWMAREPQRGTTDEYRIVGIEESNWFQG